MTAGLFMVLILSFGVAVALRVWEKARISDALTAAIMFVPALLFWVEDKGLKEFSGGPAGITVKLQDVASQSVSKIDVKLDDVAIRFDPTTSQSNESAAFWEQCGDYITVRAIDVPKERPARDRHVLNLAMAIRASLLCGRLIGVLVVDENTRYIGSYDAAFFAELTAWWTITAAKQPISPKTIVELLERHTVFAFSLRYPEKRITPGEGFVAAINRDATLATAFDRLSQNKAPFLAVTNEQGQLEGILPRDRVVDTILETLLAQ